MPMFRAIFFVRITLLISSFSLPYKDSKAKFIVNEILLILVSPHQTQAFALKSALRKRPLQMRLTSSNPLAMALLASCVVFEKR